MRKHFICAHCIGMYVCVKLSVVSCCSAEFISTCGTSKLESAKQIK